MNEELPDGWSEQPPKASWKYIKFVDQDSLKWEVAVAVDFTGKWRFITSNGWGGIRAVQGGFDTARAAMLAYEVTKSNYKGAQQ